MNNARFDRCIFFLIDGARPDALEAAVRAGKLPNIEKIFFKEGTAKSATTVFPSTTGPAYAPFLTGCFPGTCNLPGIRWLDKSRYKSGQWNLRAVRSYVGLESYLMNHDMAKDLSTLFERLQPSVNIFSVLNRGVSFHGNRTKLTRAWYFLCANFSENWARVDRAANRQLEKAIEDDFRFLFVVFPGVDENAHCSDPFSEKTTESYMEVDRAMGKIVRRLTERDLMDRTLIVASSDHGLSKTEKHLELWKVLDDLGRKTLYHPKVFRRNVDAACMVSGNGMAHLYFKGPLHWNKPMYHASLDSAGIIQPLLACPEIDQVITRKSAKITLISSSRGRATLRRRKGSIEYKVVDQDPFGFPELPEKMSDQEAINLTFSTDYPDALIQVAQLFESPRAGDAVVTSKIGYDLRDKHEIPEHFSSHGSLHKEHMLVPLLLNTKVKSNGAMRTVDVFPTILKLLGEELPKNDIDGVSLV